MAVSGIRAYGRPYDYWYDRYQAYYRAGLRAYAAAVGATYELVPMGRLPHVLGPLRHVRDRYLTHLPGGWATAAADVLGRAVEGPLRTPSSLFHNSVGQYRFLTAGGETVNVCVDAADYPELRSRELVDWSDFYFKANRWPSMEYSPKVRAVANGDPMILRRIPELRAHRGVRKERDLCFVVRVWGGRDGVEGIEHNLRLLEAVNRTRCSKRVIGYLVTGDVPAIADRLRRQGIGVITRALGAAALWRLTATSHLNVVRLGMHDCIPWRMAGALAIGACVVLDRPPRAEWPVPLRDGTNFLDLGCTPDSACYSDIPGLLETWLADAQRLEAIRESNGRYFDDHVAPERVAADMVAALGGASTIGATPNV